MCVYIAEEEEAVLPDSPTEGLHVVIMFSYAICY